MLSYILRRIAYALPITLGVTIICFSLIHLAPGDPLSAVLPDNAGPEMREQIKIAYGFDKPLPVQYLLWLKNVATGDFGLSIQSRRPVVSEVLPAARNTAYLALAAVLIGFPFGILMGAVAGYTVGGWVDRAVTSVAVTGVSVPHYWLGMVLVVIFAVNLGALPAMGMGPGGQSSYAFDWAHLRHLVLPAITLAVIPAGIIARSVRATVADIRRREFVGMLQAKGIGEGRVLYHVAKNAGPTILAVAGLQFAQLLGGSILVETVFSWPGTGFLLNTAIFTRDLPILQGTILVLSIFFVFINLVVDVLQTFLDPRIKRA
ncbi:ABC transporter permease [Prosthecodimorpha staleyi]|uniref:ABC transporter permease n=1 Tax=Prosthecodimorpha staleyi TaxID=2840188 RepID=A0A947D3Q5_9HYPH|nr:ABC transporter permease [Prosthecodimorpha staleyi]MBT9289689.1 ABC transporter permease [Prosthecodimorpha staleyi]